MKKKKKKSTFPLAFFKAIAYRRSSSSSAFLLGQSGNASPQSGHGHCVGRLHVVVWIWWLDFRSGILTGFCSLKPAHVFLSFRVGTISFFIAALHSTIGVDFLQMPKLNESINWVHWFHTLVGSCSYHETKWNVVGRGYSCDDVVHLYIEKTKGSPIQKRTFRSLMGQQ